MKEKLKKNADYVELGMYLVLLIIGVLVIKVTEALVINVLFACNGMCRTFEKIFESKHKNDAANFCAAMSWFVLFAMLFFAAFIFLT